MRTSLKWALVALVILFAAPARAELLIQANCSALGGCVFTNTGSEAGSACATLTLNGGPGQMLRSGLVCSGLLQPNSTSAAFPVAFLGGDALSFCGQQPQCTPRVEMSNLRADASGVPWSTLLWLLIFGSSVWVYFDAKKLGARPGLHPGLLDLGPGGWFFSSLFLWIIAFPAYLARRGEIAQRAAASPPPPPT